MKRVFSVPYFLAFNPNIGKHGPGKTPYLDTFLPSNVNEPAFVKTIFSKTDTWQKEVKNDAQLS